MDSLNQVHFFRGMTKTGAHELPPTIPALNFI
jgi:hypothetical protein